MSRAPRCRAADLVISTEITGRTRTEEAYFMSDPTKRAVKTLAIRLEDELHAQLVVLAQLEDKSLTDEIREALEEHIERKRSASGVSVRAQSVLDEIEREATAKRDAIKALFGDTPAAPGKEATGRRKPTDEAS